MSTLAVGTIKSISSAAPVFQNTSGTEIGQLAKVWVIYKHTTNQVLRSFGVSSVSDNGTGRFVVNFSTAFASSSYCVVIADNAPVNAGNGHCHTSLYFGNRNAANCDFGTFFDTNSGLRADSDPVCCAFYF